MFDTMTLTKIVGAVCGSLLVLLLGKFAAESIYAMGGGHGDDHAQGYVIATDDGDAAAEEEVEQGPSLEELLASADAGAGARVFNKCKACHKIDGTNATGPHLDGVYGREVDAVQDFGYSGALEEVADVWTPENLDHFIADPQGFAPGTAMNFAGINKATDRADLIAYLESISN